MRFEVPQFIDVEDKIFGPLSFKQFVYIAGGIGFAVIIYLTTPLLIAIIIAGPVLLLSAALAFYKVNDRPFILVMESAIKYTMNKRLYIWKKEDKKSSKKPLSSMNTTPFVPKLAENKLKDLSWSLDIKESLYGDGPQVKETEKKKVEFEI